MSNNRIIPAIRIKIQAIDTIRIKIWNIVNGNEATDFGIIVSGLEEVQANTVVIVIATVSERVKNTNIVAIRNLNTACVENLTVTPRIVSIFYHDGAAIVKSNDIRSVL